MQPFVSVRADLVPQLRTRLTHVIHNGKPKLSSWKSFDSDLLIGWTVNFNLSLSSFESNIQTLKNLMDLALQSPRESPPRLLFVSSVGVLART